MDPFGVKKMHEFPVSALKSEEERGWKKEVRHIQYYPFVFSRMLA